MSCNPDDPPGMVLIHSFICFSFLAFVSLLFSSLSIWLFAFTLVAAAAQQAGFSTFYGPYYHTERRSRPRSKQRHWTRGLSHLGKVVESKCSHWLSVVQKVN